MEELLSNDRIIAYHRQKQNYEPSPPNTLQFAYGDIRYEKMTYQLLQSDDILKLKNLEEINLDLQLFIHSLNPNFSNRADFITLALLSSDLLKVLIQHLANENEQIRELSSRAIIQVSKVDLGKKYIMKNNYAQNIMKLFDDPITKIRDNSYQSLLNFTEFQEGIDHCLDQQVLYPLVDKLVDEPVEDILIMVLKLMSRLLSGEQGQIEILRTPAISRLTSLLEKNNYQIRYLSCYNLQAISFSEKGKFEVIQHGCVLEIVKRLNDENQKVIETASMALVSLAQRNEAKFQIMDNDKLQIIIDLLENPDEQIKLNVVQLIASMAEHPKGRKQCEQCLELLNRYKDKYEYIAPYAEQAIDVILWVP